MELTIQRGAKKKWSVTLFRELLSNYICATEEIEQLSGHGIVQSKTEQLPEAQHRSKPSKEHIYQKVFNKCKYCCGNHWSDQCLHFLTQPKKGN